MKKHLITSATLALLSAPLAFSATSNASAAAEVNNPTPQTQLATQDPSFTRLVFNQAMSPAELLDFATTHAVSISSARHDGTTNGEMLVGNSSLRDALDLYTATNQENFGVDPAIVEAVVSGPLGSAAQSSLVRTSQQVALPSTDPGEAAEPDVTAANVQDAWAPAGGTMYAATTAQGRTFRHRMSWDTRAGLNGYLVNGEQYVYEHDLKLYDNNPYRYIYTGYGMTQSCADEFWVDGDTRIVSTTAPSAAKAYADNVRFSDGCGTYDVSFGFFHPEKLAADTTYTIVVGAPSGGVTSSPYALLGQKLANQCPGEADNASCISLTDGDPREDSIQQVNRSRGWKVPGCYTWTRNASPVQGSC